MIYVEQIKKNTPTLYPENLNVSAYQALQAITSHAAYQYFEEDRKGTIKEGLLADLVILDKNPLKVSPETIKEIQVLKTIKEGQIIFEK